ncbi:MAG TPA: GNAT family N-acetyltransferase [Candidatus Cottocaccamicrobium excrementipullorum]|nr:GNAT family N-acetyltransferase [Candidatus Cottocaccamicrobium excrementipullorum]
MNKRELNHLYTFRSIRPDEGYQAAEIERICFPPQEACTQERMLKRVSAAPELFLTAEEKSTGRLAGFLNGIATDEEVFRDEFFTDIQLHNPKGRNVMLLGLDVLPQHRGQGLASMLMEQYLGKEQRKGRKKIFLTCLPDKVKMYEKMGFKDHGLADSSWGGEQWHEMSCTINE